MSSPEMGNRPAVNEATQGTHTKQVDNRSHYHTDACQFATTSAGEICLSAIGADSPTPRYEVYLFGYMNGRESLAWEIQRLRWERDLFYFQLANPGKSGADFYRHLTSELWRQGVAA